LFFTEEDQDGIDDTQIEGFINAKNAGINLDIMLTPCRGRSASEEMKFIIKQLGENVVDRLWVVPDDI
jgi:hypothetical protein